ncbi:MAG: PKD domain-containing protein, partial [Bacteroidota bacterium]
MKKKSLLLLIALLWGMVLGAQPSFTANDVVLPYEGTFRPGSNLGVFPPWLDEQLGEIAAGNPAIGVDGVGIKAIRPALFEHFVEQYGYELKVPTYQFFDQLGLKDNTLIVGFPSVEHSDPTQYCPGVPSELFANLYLDIWDNGEQGTPVNDQNYYALYIYKLVQLYGPYIRFWEIWNEPGFDYTGARGWAEPGQPGNWWENNPNPCDYKLRAPIFHYIRILRISYEVIKTLDPNAYVTLSGVGFPSFLDAILRNTDNPVDGSVTADYPKGGGAYFDVMGYHAYPHFDGSLRYWDNTIQDFAYIRHSDGAADGLIRSQDLFREVLNNYGYNGQTYPRKLWIITECNIPRKAFGEYIGSDESQRNFMIKAYLQCVINDILQLHVYKIGEDAKPNNTQFEFDLMGLYEQLEGVDPYFATKTQAGIAYKTTSDLLFDSQYDAQRTAALNLPNGLRGSAFYDQYGNYTYVLWAETRTDRSEQASGVYSFPASLNIRHLIKREWDYSDHRQQNIIGPQSINLSGDPIFLTEVRFTADQYTGCVPMTVNFSDQSQGSFIRRWTFEGGTPATATGTNPTVLFDTPGDHEVQLELLDANGHVIFSQKDRVFAQKTPQADFESYISGPMAVLTNLSDQEADDFIWDFGDGTSSTEPNPIKVYFEDGDYTIQLTASNECGANTKAYTINAHVPSTSLINYTAKDVIVPYDGPFRPGTNMGVYQGWSDEQLADISAGNVLEGVEGIGAKCVRPILDEKFMEKWGYDIRLDAFQHYVNLDLRDNTLMVGFPTEDHQDPNFYCANDQSELFENMYLDIWDNGENGTPVNEENYYARYLYEVAIRYKDFVKFWEIWNEPSFDYAGHGWKPPGIAGNWWDNNPNPCDYKLKAPIFHFVRLLRISYEVIKYVDPEAYVTLSGVAFPSFLDAILRNTDNPQDGQRANGYPHRGGAYFDVMGFHHYPHFDGSTSYYDVDLGQIVYQRHSDAAAAGIGRLQDEFRELLATYGYDGNQYPQKHWIVTEASLPRKPFGNYMGSAESQRNYLLKAFVSCMKREVRQLHVYKIGEEKHYDEADDEFQLMGLYQKLDNIAPYNQTVNDEGIAFKTASDLLYGTRFDPAKSSALNLPSTIDGGAFKDANGQYIYVLWAKTNVDFSEQASATYSFPPSFNLNQLSQRNWDYSTTGNAVNISPQTIPLSGAPIFLLENNTPLQPPTAAFISNKKLGCIPLAISFTDQSIHADSWSWSFPGATPASSSAQHPNVVYETPGVYPVSLEVRNAAGSHTFTYNDYIEVKTVPDATFSFTTNGPWVDFTSLVGYDDSIAYFWQFGDGYTTPGLDPDHFYFVNGDYTVQLTATNSCGSATTQQLVSLQNPPGADFTRVAYTDCPPHRIKFLDLSYSSPESWLWSFPGGQPTTSTERNPIVQYPEEGSYEAILIVSNGFGSDTLIQTYTLGGNVSTNLNLQLCPGENIIVNGTLYDENNPIGTEVFAGASLLGCDSLVNVQLTYQQASSTVLQENLCPGESLMVNGTLYDENNPVGTEIVAGSASGNCDSTIYVELSFDEISEAWLNPRICPGEAILVNGNIYDQTQSSGTEILTGANAQGCDSIVYVDLDFYTTASSTLSPTLCAGDFVLINGQVFNENNPIGTVYIPNAGTNNCDSIVEVNLSFHPPAVKIFEQSLCRDAEVVINGSVYNQANPSGVELLIGGSHLGCDST